MEIVIILALIGFIVGLAVLWCITSHELNRLKKRYCELKTEHNFLDSKYELLKISLEKTDGTLKALNDVIGTLVELTNETTKWIQEVSPEIRRKLL